MKVCSDNNLQHQIYELQKQIKDLQSKVMDWYLSDTLLAYDDTYVAREDTNVPAGVYNGFLMTETAMIFKIVGGDEDTLLIEFWAVPGGRGGNTPQLI